MPVAEWTPTRRSDAFDLAVAAVFAVGIGLSLNLNASPEVSGDHADYPKVLGAVAATVLALTLVPRRRFPLTSLLVGTVAFTVIRVFEIPEFAVSGNILFVLLYTAGAYGGARRDVVRTVTAVTVGVLVVLALVPGEDSPLAGSVSAGLAVLFFTVTNAVFLVAGWMLGDQVRNARIREAELAAQATALAAAQEERAQRAVLDERVRIARELHDVLAQHVSVMGVQAAAARRVLGTRPDEVPELLLSIEAAGRDAVVELHRLLGLLRDHGGEDTVARHRLAQVPRLVEQVTDAGLHVDIDLDGVLDADAALPVGVELSAYRITQEALTNALKHGGPGTHATVTLRRRPAALELTVLDDGRGSAPPAVAAGARPPGHGLVGMRERAELHGGELKTRRPAGGGFEVRAWFPLAAGGRRARWYDVSAPPEPPEASDTQPLRIVLVDDQQLVRRGLRLILESEPGIIVVAEATDGADAVDAARRHRPDVVLMDIQMPGMDGLDATRRITATGTRVVVVTTFERDDYILEAVRAGASGYLLKSAPPEDLLDALRAAVDGAALLSPSVTRRVLDRLAAEVPASDEARLRLDLLTEREIEVLGLVAAGLSNAEIAQRLVLGEATVKTHVSRVLAKLHLRDRVQAVVFAYESGLVRPSGRDPAVG